MKSNPFWQVIKIAPFRNLWLSQVVSQIFLNLLIFSLMIRVYELSKSSSAVSLVLLLFTLPNIIFAAMAGIVADRGDRKTIMFLSHFLRIFAVLAFLLSTESLSWIYISVAVVSSISQLFFPAEAASIREYVTDKKLLLTANSLFSLTFFLSVIVGDVLAGPLLALMGDRGAYVIVALAFLVASLFTSRLPGETFAQWWKQIMRDRPWKTWQQGLAKFRGDVVFSDFLTGIDHIYKTPAVQKGIFVMAISQVSVGALATAAPAFMDKILHRPPVDISIYMMLPAAIGMVFGAFILGQFLRKVDKQMLVRLGVLFLGVFLLAFGWINSLVFSVIVVFASGVLNAFLDVPGNTMISENTPNEVRSRVYGVLNTVVGGAALVPIVATGVIADVLGVRAVFMVLGGVLLFLCYRYL